MMHIFDVDRNSAEYPERLRLARKRLKLSQADFGVAAGHSGVMQGRYETERSKSNSATPSAKTAKAIRALIESSELTNIVDATIAGNAGINITLAPPDSLKQVSVHEIEQAISTAISALISKSCMVSISDVTWSGQKDSDVTLSLSIFAQK